MSRPRSVLQARALGVVAAGLLVLTTLAAIGQPAGAEPDGPDLPQLDRSLLEGLDIAELDAGDIEVEPRLGAEAGGRQAYLLRLEPRSTAQVFWAQRRAQGRVAARASARSQLVRIERVQQRVIDRLPRRTPVLYRTHAVLAGVAVTADADSLDALGEIPDVVSVHPIREEFPDNGSAVTLHGAPAAWGGTAAALGDGVRVGIIDSGIDHTHATFGGSGTTAAYDSEHAYADDDVLWTGSGFPNNKVVGGYDLVGDAYNADRTSHSYNPVAVADPNPLDCTSNGHGTHVAGSVAGYGVGADGSTYAGPYVPGMDLDSLKVGPGMAPDAELLAFRVFGCTGSTNLTVAAIDMALDPNGDGSTADAVDVINLSLGSNFGSPDDASAVAVEAAVAAGVTMVVSSGNAGDLYDVGASPGTAQGALTAAASVDAQSVVDGLSVQIDGVDAPDMPYPVMRSAAYDWPGGPDFVGDVVAPVDDPTGCTAFGATDAAAIDGQIALLAWNDDAPECGSIARGLNVRNAGGVGFIFASNRESFSAGITGDPSIPGVLVSRSGAAAIRAALADDLAVTVTGTKRNGARQQIPADEDKVAGFSSRGIRTAGNLKPDVSAVGATVFSAAVGTGDDGVAQSGTSMAAPMVAGLAALVVGEQPAWTPEQVKAGIMNTAGHDLYVDGATASGARYAPNRVGSGRIDAEAAVTNDTIAYVEDDPGAVSVSFGPVEVTAPVTLTKTVTVQNTGTTERTYDTSYDAITTIPGVAYDIAPATVSVEAGASAEVTVTLRVDDPRLLTKTVDPTKGRALGSTPIETLADASGNLLLTPAAGGSALRVPVYSAPRPASEMAQPDRLTLDDGFGSLQLIGREVDQGTGSEQIVSTVAGLELQATSPVAPNCQAAPDDYCVATQSDSGVDLAYVGVASDAPLYGDPGADGVAYFGIATHGVRTLPANRGTIQVYLDANGDGAWDGVLYNRRVDGADVFVTALLNRSTDVTRYGWPMAIRGGDVDLAALDSDVLLMPLPVSELAPFGINSGSPTLAYAVASFNNEGRIIDEVGFAPSGAIDGNLSLNAYAPGILATGKGVSGGALDWNSLDGPLVEDADETEIDVTRNPDTYTGDGLLMLHFHNQVGEKAQVVELGEAVDVTLSASPSSLWVGQSTTLTVGVTDPDEEGTPIGAVSVRDTGTDTIVATGTLTDGSVSLDYSPAIAGTSTLVAQYDGDRTYLSGVSAARSVTASWYPPPVIPTPTPTPSDEPSPTEEPTPTPAASTVTLAAPSGPVVRGHRVEVTVSVGSDGDSSPSGTVTLLADGAVVASGAVGASGSTSLGFAPAERGRISLSAAYSGDERTSPGSSSSVTLKVTKAKSTVRLDLSRKRGKPGKQVQAEVVVPAVFAIPATGRVVLKRGKQRLGAGRLVDGVVTIAFAPTRPGRMRVRAVYRGDSSYAKGRSAKVVYVVKRLGVKPKR